MATYNGESFILEQLSSILQQLSSQDEVIVSDDCSTDSTVQLIEQLHDSRVTILKGTRFASPILNFENALKHSKGDIIFLSDQDDVWMLDKVHTVKVALERYDLIFSNASIIDQKGAIIRNYFYYTNPPKNILSNLLFNHYFGATMAFKRKVLRQALPFPVYIPMHDQWLGIIANYFFSVGYIEQPLIKYRRHGNNASFCGEKSFNTIRTKMLFRVNIVRALLSRIF